MSTDPTGAAGPHPDLRELYCDALGQLRQQMSNHPGAGPPIPANLQPDDLTVRSQRTWYGVEGFSAEINGSNYAAAIVQFSDGANHFSFFMEAKQPDGSGEWLRAGTSGGARPQQQLDDSGGFNLSGGSHVCVGGLTQRCPKLKAIEVEHADGSRVSAPVGDDGAIIVLAPIMSEPSPSDEVIVRYLDGDGNAISEDRAWIGNGGPPPPEIMQRMAR